MSFDRLIRFIDGDDKIHYGNLEESLPAGEILGREVQILSGDLNSGWTKTNERRKVKKLLTTLENVPAVICAGINYKTHVKEADSIVSSKPVLFMTPPERLTGPLDEILVHDDAQSHLDYEGELAYVFARDAKDVDEKDALNYILGYAVANDVSARNLVSKEVAFYQMGHSKSFDTFGPLGPIVSPSAVSDPHNLRLTTKVNGEVRQDSSTKQMIWSIAQQIAWLCKNRTIKKGTVVMTGTPGGVGWFIPDGFLKHGDIVDVEISELGSISNRVRFI